jgi:multicomponent K+:H+ antiporter subunit E
MTRWLPYPLVSAGLLLLWLLLQGKVSIGHLVLGTVFGVAGGLALARLEPPPLRLRRPAVFVELFFVVLADIVRSNLAVARIILGPRSQLETAGFMTIPIEMRSPWGLAALAVIITSTPGTLWVNFDGTRGLLTIHVLDLVDEKTWIGTIKGRYEKRLMEIFE